LFGETLIKADLNHGKHLLAAGGQEHGIAMERKTFSRNPLSFYLVSIPFCKTGGLSEL
jgi:hypothetical protein